MALPIARRNTINILPWRNNENLRFIFNIISTLCHVYMYWNITWHSINMYNFTFCVFVKQWTQRKKLKREALINNHKIYMEPQKAWRAKAMVSKKVKQRHSIIWLQNIIISYMLMKIAYQTSKLEKWKTLQ
jgi:hypothetical protein